jgi:predicted TIM-barrel fold metal-dependent hydrolase
LHDDAARLVGILDRIDGRATRLVIDHFGRPESLALAQDDPVYDELLNRMVRDNSYVKISAPYRSPNMNPARAYQKLSQILGEEKLLWASDWPWTQNEDSLTYAQWANPFTGTDDSVGTSHPTLPDRLAKNAKLFYEFDD